MTAARSLRELLENTALLTCASGDVPTVRRICFGARWLVVDLSDGRAGRAFAFSGQHAVYGAIDLARVEALRFAVGHDALSVARWAAGACGTAAEGGVRDVSGVERAALEAGFDSLADEDLSTISLRRTFALAIMNALSCRMNAPEELASRGFAIFPGSDRSFLHPRDSVVLVGAGMLLREAAETCAHVDVVDMRPRSSLESVLLDGAGVTRGPRNVAFHGVEDTASLVAQADVIGVTGCAIGNETLFDIARMPRSAREFVVFGPSAQVPLELLMQLGVTRVVTSLIVDVDACINSMLDEFGSQGPREATRGYVAAPA